VCENRPWVKKGPLTIAGRAIYKSGRILKKFSKQPYTNPDKMGYFPQCFQGVQFSRERKRLSKKLIYFLQTNLLGQIWTPTGKGSFSIMIGII
jgi:hypothetical protein